jgi:hAT family C-terminal dimerisation region
LYINKDKYKILSLIARKYLQIPATSASSERFFSQGSLIISKLRNKLNKDTFNMIICLKSWGIFKDEEEIEEKRAKLDIKEEENIFCIN